MNILLVGAGAVGQAYGWHLQRGGASVSFMVHDKYAAACRAGLTLYPLNRPKATRWQPVPFAGFGVLTRPDSVATATWDQVWLCISSPALRGPWLDELLATIGTATSSSSDPACAIATPFWSAGRQNASSKASSPCSAIKPRCPEWARIPASRCCLLLSAPVRDPVHGPSSPDAGGGRRLAGGRMSRQSSSACPPAGRARIGGAHAACGRPRNRRMVCAGPPQEPAADACRARLPRGHADRCHVHRLSPPAARHVVHPLLTRLALGLAPHLLPFDLEAYLRYHFTKVSAQTRAAMAVYLALGTELGLPSTHLERPFGNMRLGCEAGQWPLPQACKRVVRSARQWRGATARMCDRIPAFPAPAGALQGRARCGYCQRAKTRCRTAGRVANRSWAPGPPLLWYANVVAIRCRLTPSPRRDTSAPRKTCNQFCAMMVHRYEAVNMASRMAVFSTKVIPRIRRFMMNDPRPDIAIGHVRLLVGNVAKTTDFFVKLGIRTIVEQADFAVLELRGGTHLVLRTWEEPEGDYVPFEYHGG